MSSRQRQIAKQLRDAEMRFLALQMQQFKEELEQPNNSAPQESSTPPPSPSLPATGNFEDLGPPIPPEGLKLTWADKKPEELNDVFSNGIDPEENPTPTESLAPKSKKSNKNKKSRFTISEFLGKKVDPQENIEEFRASYGCFFTGENEDANMPEVLKSVRRLVPSLIEDMLSRVINKGKMREFMKNNEQFISSIVFPKTLDKEKRAKTINMVFKALKNLMQTYQNISRGLEKLNEHYCNEGKPDHYILAITILIRFLEENSPATVYFGAIEDRESVALSKTYSEGLHQKFSALKGLNYDLDDLGRAIADFNALLSSQAWMRMEARVLENRSSHPPTYKNGMKEVRIIAEILDETPRKICELIASKYGIKSNDVASEMGSGKIEIPEMDSNELAEFLTTPQKDLAKASLERNSFEGLQLSDGESSED